MPVEPVGATLAVVGLFHPLFVSCRALYQGYQITQSFGDDFDITKRRLDIQCARLEGISRKKLRFLKNSFEPFDKDDPITKAIISHLVVMQNHFQICHAVLKKYHDFEQEVVDSTNDVTIAGVEDPGPKATSSATQMPQAVLTSTTEDSPPGDTVQLPPVVESFTNKLRKHLQRLERISKRSGSKRTESTFSRDQSLARASTASTRDATTGGAVSSQGTPSAILAYRQESLTPATTTSPSILETQSIRDDETNHENCAKKLKTSNRFLRRVIWAADDKKLIYYQIDELRKCNNELESLLQLRPPKDVRGVLASRGLGTPVQELSEIQASIKLLHDTLASVNDAKGAKQVHISIQLRADCRSLFEILPEDHELKLRNGSCMFLLHVHGLGGDNHQDGALEVLVETPPSTSHDSIPLQPLSSLSELEGAIANLPDEVDYKQVGTVASRVSSEVHQIIATDRSTWYKVDNLQNVLGSEHFRDRLTPIQRIYLASTIAITHLYFANIRVTCTEVGPVNIIYYNDTTDRIPWVDLEPFVLNPFLSIGFGSRKPRIKLGFSSGRPVQKNTTVAELGLLLHQIGSNARIDYGQGPEGFRRAKEHALETIHAVDKGIGPRYAEITQMCLEWKPASLYTSPGDDDWQAIQGVVAWLMDFQSKLER